MSHRVRGRRCFCLQGGCEGADSDMTYQVPGIMHEFLFLRPFCRFEITSKNKTQHAWPFKTTERI